MKRLKFTRTPPAPLPADPDLLDRLEYALQWGVSWLTFSIEGHPAIGGLLGGLLTGVVIGVPLILVAWLMHAFGRHQ